MRCFHATTLGLVLLLAGCGSAGIKTSAPLGTPSDPRGRAVPAAAKSQVSGRLPSKTPFVCVVCPGTTSLKPDLCPGCGRTLVPSPVKEGLARRRSIGPKIEFEVTYTPKYLPGTSPPAEPPK
ncbi:MAG: hypothetical protein HYY93_08135 [Planctomycetes bacterium]|nr:hypothetical protein [Planctomycetota bacterium]